MLVGINKICRELQVPHVVKRRFPGLRASFQYKSSELKLFLFYWALPVLLSCWPRNNEEDDNHWHLLAMYALGVRLLYEPNDSEKVERARVLIRAYHNQLEETFGVSAYTYTIHAHLHLSKQVLLHGPLHSHSQFVFEVSDTEKFV